MDEEDFPEELRILVRQVSGDDDDQPSELPEETPTPTPSPTPTPASAPAPQTGGGQLVSVKRPSRGGYVLEEGDLTEEDKRLLHGRAFVIDRHAVTDTSSGSAEVFYIAYDQVQGLVVPGRSMDIQNHGQGSLHYRWSDDGEKWTAWITLEEGGSHNYATDEKCRFAEVQAYASVSGTLLSIRATR